VVSHASGGLAFCGLMERHQLLCQIDRCLTGSANFVTRALNLPASALTTPRVGLSRRRGVFSPLSRGESLPSFEAMVTITITAEAFASIAGTLVEGSKGDARPDGKGGYLIVLPHAILDRLKTMRGPGESYSDVILALAKGV
jgi:hypothetical protein